METDANCRVSDTVENFRVDYAYTASRRRSTLWFRQRPNARVFFLARSAMVGRV